MLPRVNQSAPLGRKCAKEWDSAIAPKQPVTNGSPGSIPGIGPSPATVAFQHLKPTRHLGSHPA